MLLRVVRVSGWSGPSTRTWSGSSSWNRRSASAGIPALAGPGRDVAAGGQGVGVVVALDAAAQGEFLAAVVEGWVVVAERVVVGGEGVVQAQQVVVGAGGCAGEFVLEQDDLQPGIGVGAADGAQDRCGGVLLRLRARC